MKPSADEARRPIGETGSHPGMTAVEPYPSYRDSGVEWLGEVPERWEVRRLRYVIDGKPAYGAAPRGRYRTGVPARCGAKPHPRATHDSTK